MLKTEILFLRSQNKTYNEICNILHCSKSLVSYYCNVDGKIKKDLRQKRFRKKSHPFLSKIYFFTKRKRGVKSYRGRSCNFRQLLNSKLKNFKGKNMTINFTVDDVIKKFGESPKCSLTGQPIDIGSPRTYQFDHKIPVSRGGDNSLENLQILTRQANLAKSDLTNDEFIHLCKQVLENTGYNVTK